MAAHFRMLLGRGSSNWLIKALDPATYLGNCELVTVAFLKFSEGKIFSIYLLANRKGKRKIYINISFFFYSYSTFLITSICSCHLNISWRGGVLRTFFGRVEFLNSYFKSLYKRGVAERGGKRGRRPTT